MKKILITLRHPGPVQAIAAVLPYLAKYYQVIVVATDDGLPVLIRRFSGQINNIQLYYLYHNKWKLYSEQCEDWKKADKAEFDRGDIGLEQLRDKVIELIKKIQPETVLRTTPTIKMGIDEIITDICYRIFPNIQCLCYQEDYGCGINLHNMSAPIAVVDRHAQKLMKEADVNSVVVGWLGQNIYQYYKTYNVARLIARKKLGISDEEYVILYSLCASKSFRLDLEHFKLILNRIDKCKVYYKFHPRNTDYQRKIIRGVAQDKAIMLPDTISYEEAISFPDFIVSVASALNQDSLQYQIECHEEKLSTISVYTKGKISTEILRATVGTSKLPHIREGMGSVIINENNISDKMFTFENIHLKGLLSEAKERFGLSEKERLDNLIKYIEGV